MTNEILGPLHILDVALIVVVLNVVPSTWARHFEETIHQSAWKGYSPKVRFTILHRFPSEGLENGVRGSAAVRESGLNGVSESVIRDAHCPVCMVRGAGST